MRNFSKMTMSLLIGATVLTPIAAQAQDRGDRPVRERGAMRGGDNAGAAPRAVQERSVDRGSWQQRGTDNAAAASRAAQERSVNRGDWQQRGGGVDNAARQQQFEQRRQAVEQGRAAAAVVERPAPLPPSARVDPVRERGAGRNDWRGDHGNDARGNDARTNDGRSDEQRRRWVETRNGGARPDNDGIRGNDARRGGRDTDRNRVGIDDRRDRDRDGRIDRNDRNGRDGNQRWSSDRRDWNRDGGDRRDWDRGWRNDRRYSWQDYRNRNRSHYRLPRYQPPRWGLSYRRWYPGYRFDSVFYGSSYWISDSWSYRLPPAYGPYRWVRYYDDAVLVDVDTGEIADIIYSFFF